jgi:hypothetical protein
MIFLSLLKFFEKRVLGEKLKKSFCISSDHGEIIKNFLSQLSLIKMVFHLIFLNLEFQQKIDFIKESFNA